MNKAEIYIVNQFLSSLPLPRFAACCCSRNAAAWILPWNLTSAGNNGLYKTPHTRHSSNAGLLDSASVVWTDGADMDLFFVGFAVLPSASIDGLGIGLFVREDASKSTAFRRSRRDVRMRSARRAGGVVASLSEKPSPSSSEAAVASAPKPGAGVGCGCGSGFGADETRRCRGLKYPNMVPFEDFFASVNRGPGVVSREAQVDNDGSDSVSGVGDSGGNDFCLLLDGSAPESGAGRLLYVLDGRLKLC